MNSEEIEELRQSKEFLNFDPSTLNTEIQVTDPLPEIESPIINSTINDTHDIIEETIPEEKLPEITEVEVSNVTTKEETLPIINELPVITITQDKEELLPENISWKKVTTKPTNVPAKPFLTFR